MKIIYWNVRGLRNPRTFRALSDLLKVRHPSILFLSETKCGVDTANKVKKIGNFQGCLTVKSKGTKGGLFLLWKDDVVLRVNSYSKNYKDLEISWEHKIWRFTGSMDSLKPIKKL